MKFTAYLRIVEEGQLEIEADSEEEARQKLDEMRFTKLRHDWSLDDDRLEIVDIEERDT